MAVYAPTWRSTGWGCWTEPYPQALHNRSIPRLGIWAFWYLWLTAFSSAFGWVATETEQGARIYLFAWRDRWGKFRPTKTMSDMPKKQANPIDVQVGSRVRIRRMLIGMSQERLGDLLGLTFQQVQ